jgi:hypothetical protein
MGLLARVDTLMDCQRRALDELLAAVGVLAHMGTDAAVDAFCLLLELERFWCGGPSS